MTVCNHLIRREGHNYQSVSKAIDNGDVLESQKGREINWRQIPSQRTRSAQCDRTLANPVSNPTKRRPGVLTTFSALMFPGNKSVRLAQDMEAYKHFKRARNGDIHCNSYSYDPDIKSV